MNFFTNTEYAVKTFTDSKVVFDTAPLKIHWLTVLAILVVFTILIAIVPLPVKLILLVVLLVIY